MKGSGMAPKATRLTVTIPWSQYEALEQVRRATGKSRSAVVQAALRHWLEGRARAALVRQYEAGYRRQPEGHREIRAAHAAAACVLAADNW